MDDANKATSFPLNIQGITTNSTEWTDEDIIIAVVGNAGSGKTSFINTAATVTMPVGHGMNPCTKNIAATRMTIPELTKQAVVLVDTPGLDVLQSSVLSGHNIIKAVTEWLRKNYRRRASLSGILFVQQISDTAKLSFRGIQQSVDLLGTKPTFPRMRLVTTMWDEVESADAEANEKTILLQWSKAVVNPDLLPCRFDLTQISAIRILLPFIRTANQRAAVHMVQEVSSLRTSSNLTAATLQTLSRFFAQRQEIFTHLLDELEKSNPDRSALEALVREHEELGNELEKYSDMIKLMKPPFSDMVRGAINWVISWNWISSLLGFTTPTEDLTEPLARIQPLVSQISADDKVILLLGRTGSGKSQFVSDCVGFDAGINPDLMPCDTSVNLIEGRVDRSRHFFIEAPGFDQSENISDAAIVKQVRIWLTALHQQRVRVCGVVFLHSVSAKLQIKDFLPSKGLLSTFLEERIPVTMVTTHWDEELEDLDRTEQLHNSLVNGLWGNLIRLGAKEMKLGRSTDASQRHDLNHYQTALGILRDLIGSTG